MCKLSVLVLCSTILVLSAMELPEEAAPEKRKRSRSPVDGDRIDKRIEHIEERIRNFHARYTDGVQSYNRPRYIGLMKELRDCISAKISGRVVTLATGAVEALPVVRARLDEVERDVENLAECMAAYAVFEADTCDCGHALVRSKRTMLERMKCEVRECDCCGKEPKTHAERQRDTYRCEECDYDQCISCHEQHQAVRSRWHDVTRAYREISDALERAGLAELTPEERELERLENLIRELSETDAAEAAARKVDRAARKAKKGFRDAGRVGARDLEEGDKVSTDSSSEEEH